MPNDDATQRLRGILLLIAGVGCFALLDTCAKGMAQWFGYPTAQIVGARYAGHAAIAVLFMLTLGRGARWWPRRPWLQVVRSALLFGSTVCNFLALRHLQLAETGAIMFAVPLLIGALSVPLLGERVGPRRWSAILVGFVGVLIVIRPGLGVMQWPAAYALAAALFAALYMITTRMLAGHDHPATTQLHSALVGTVLIAPVAPFAWTPPDAPGVALMLLIGAFAALGHYLVILAHERTPAPVLAPFGYTQIVWMLLIGYLAFADLPDGFTLLGAAVVVASGLYLWYRERQLAGALPRAAGVGRPRKA